MTPAPVATPEGAAGAGRRSGLFLHLRSRPWAPLALILAAGVIVFLPAVLSPFFFDDFVHAAMVDGTYPVARSPFNLYDFIDDADRPLMVARGMFPWWTEPHFSLRFFRPLASVICWAEHRFLGDAPLVFHLHSLLWWGVAVLGAHALFRRLLRSWPARVATAIFALAPCHTVPLAWLANRYQLISLALGTWALLAYLRWREGRGLRDGALAAALFGLSMLGGEYAICFGGYVAAYELAARGERLGKRALGLAPFVAPAAAYLAARGALHYGVRGSGIYEDPFRDPGGFFGLVPRRLAVLILDGWFSLDPDTLGREIPTWAVALALAAALALVVPPLLRLDEEGRPTRAWLLLGSLLALAPVTLVMGHPRLCGASMLGVAANVALILEQAFRPARQPSGGARAAAHLGSAALVLCFAHLVHGPVTSWLVARIFKVGADASAQQLADVRARLAEGKGDEVVVMRSLGAAILLPWMDQRGAAGGPWRVLAQAGHVLALRRDPRTLELVVPSDQAIFPAGEPNLFRSARSRVAAGDVFQVPGMRVTILDVGVGGPRRVRYELDRDLDAAPLRWISETQAGFPDVKLPAPGFGASFDP